jgi:flagellar basal body P-ring protein FlgI
MGKIVEINAETNEVIEREETAVEAKDRAKLQAEYEARIASEEAAKTARSSALAKLAALGLTPEEINAIS